MRGPARGQTIQPVSRAQSIIRSYPYFSCLQVLLLSYMRHKHGRIIQADYNGERLNLQCSQLWSFENKETAPVELFVRYNLSEPVGIRG